MTPETVQGCPNCGNPHYRPPSACAKCDRDVVTGAPGRSLDPVAEEEADHERYMAAQYLATRCTPGGIPVEKTDALVLYPAGVVAVRAQTGVVYQSQKEWEGDEVTWVAATRLNQPYTADALLRHCPGEYWIILWQARDAR